MRRFLIVIVIVLLAYILGTISIRAIQVYNTPDWRFKLGKKPEPIAFPPSSPFSTEHQRLINYLNIDILYADQWTEREVSELLDLIDIPPISDDDLSGSNYDEAKAIMSHKRGRALSAISERFAVDAPIDEDQRQILIDRLTEGMYQTDNIRYRTMSIANVIRAGLADNPGPIRDRVFLFYNNRNEYKDQRGISEAELIKRLLVVRETLEIEGDN